MIRALQQRHTDVTDPMKGDCFATCVAMLLGLSQDEVPNFCEIPAGWFERFQHWLEQRRLVAIEVNVEVPSLAILTNGTFCILSGPSPRGAWLHSVVGMSKGVEGFEMLHDPHPSNLGICGELKTVTFIASLRPDLLLAAGK